MAKKKQAEKPKAKPHAKFLAAIDALVKAHNSGDGLVSKAFSGLIDNVSDAMPEGDMGIVGMHLHIETMAFLVEAERYDNRMDLDPDATVEDQPHDNFWRALSRVSDLYRDYGKPPKSHRAPETVAYLVKTVPDQGQIAAMLGLFTEDGQRDLARLQQEIANPGSVINDEFVHPDDAKDIAKLEEEHGRYVEELERQKAGPNSESTCPEAPEDLYRQAVGLDQAIVMLAMKPHKLTPEQVGEKWAKFKEAGIEQEGVVTTNRTGQPFLDYVPIAGPLETTSPLPEPEEDTTEETTPDSVYAQSSNEELMTLCEVAEIADAGMDREAMVAALEEADRNQVEV